MWIHGRQCRPAVVTTVTAEPQTAKKTPLIDAHLVPHGMQEMSADECCLKQVATLQNQTSLLNVHDWKLGMTFLLLFGGIQLRWSSSDVPDVNNHIMWVSAQSPRRTLAVSVL